MSNYVQIISTYVESTLSTGPRSVVVSASDCGLKDLGFESHHGVMRYFSALAGSYPELGAPWAQWEGCVLESVALTI